MSVRRPIVAIVVAAALGFRPAAPAAASATVSAEPVLVIEGKGNGHGVGLSQDGALAMGRDGATTEEILAKFYPGTDMASAGGEVGVRVLESAVTSVDVTFPEGGEVHAHPDGPQPEGFPVTVAPGGVVMISLEEGVFRAEPEAGPPEVTLPAIRLIVDDPAVPADAAGVDATTSTTTDGVPVGTVEDRTATTAPDDMTTTTAESPTTTTTTTVPTPPSAPPVPDPPAPARSSVEGLWLVPAEGSTTALAGSGREYRGVVEVGDSSLGGLLLVNRLDVEEYLKGMGEVLDPAWPAAALQSQAVAARTYALRATRAGGTLCDDDRCQVYLGAGAEYQAMDEAVDASSGEVRAFGGTLASTVYSASGGGVTATPQEGFGTDGSDYPYLLSTPYAVADPPVWSTSIALADLGRRVDYPGHAREAVVTASGPSGRVLEVALDGDAGRRTVDGLRFASRLNLDSTLFTMRPAIGTPSPPPVSARGSIQAPPDIAGLLPPLLGTAAADVRGAGGLDAAHASRSALTLAAAALLLLARRRRRAALRSR